MTGLEVIIAALVAGAASGTSQVAGTAVNDAYTGLRGALRRRLDGRGTAVQQLDGEPTGDADVWRARLGRDVTESGADRDAEILAAARTLLALTDPAGAQTGKYVVTVTDSDRVQVGDGNIQIGTSYGPTAGTMTGPVTVTYNDQVPVPPAAPTAP